MLFLHSPFASLQIASISQKKQVSAMSSASVFVAFDQEHTLIMWLWQPTRLTFMGTTELYNTQNSLPPRAQHRDTD